MVHRMLAPHMLTLHTLAPHTLCPTCCRPTCLHLTCLALTRLCPLHCRLSALALELHEREAHTERLSLKLTQDLELAQVSPLGCLLECVHPGL